MASLKQFSTWLLCVSCVFLTYTRADPVIQNMVDKEVVLNAAENMIRHYSASYNVTGEGLTSHEFVALLTTATSHTSEFIQKVAGPCLAADNNCTWKAGKCPGVDEIFQSFAVDEHLTAQGLINALPIALNTLTSENCTKGFEEVAYHGKKTRKPSFGEAWGYGLGFASTVIIISNIGACLGPIMEKKFFKRLLQFLVAMGAGSLASTGLLVLIPESFDVMAVEELSDYIWKATVAIISVYVLFCSERILKTTFHKRRVSKEDSSLSMTIDPPDKSDIDGLALAPLNNAKEDGHGHSHLPPGMEQSGDRTTLAWMVMAGDIIHNFVDGLSIGAGFTENIGLGISISLAVICEELPHELADIAILLHAGLSIKKSLLINFLSACVIYIGLIIGIMLGTMITAASRWIFAVAGGLFLYVPLVDMLPDMSAHLDSLLQRGGHEAKIVAALHTLGLIIGAGIIVFIVNISSFIVVE